VAVRMWRDRVRPALLQGILVGGRMALFAMLSGFDPLIIGGLFGMGTMIVIMFYPHG
jgi:hypothetical protein